MLTDEWYESLRKAAEGMLSDRCEVWRGAETVRPNGTTTITFAQIRQDMPCRISRIASRKDDVRQQLPPLTFEMDARLYCAPNSDVRAGDRIVIQRAAGGGWERQYTAGDMFVYPSHCEIPLQREGEA